MSPRRDVLLAEQTQLYQLSGYVLVVLLLLSRDKDGDWVVWSRVAGERRAIQESIRHRLATTWTLTLRDPCCRRSFDDLARMWDKVSIAGRLRWNISELPWPDWRSEDCAAATVGVFAADKMRLLREREAGGSGSGSGSGRLEAGGRVGGWRRDVGEVGGQ